MRINEHDICIKGFEALLADRGCRTPADAERFIMLMNRGAGDYTEWRKTHLYQNLSLEELAEEARRTGQMLRQSSTNRVTA